MQASKQAIRTCCTQFKRLVDLESETSGDIPDWVMGGCGDDGATVGKCAKSAYLGDFMPKPPNTFGPQDPHVDYRVTGERRFLRVMITALADFTLLVWPGSHHWVRRLPQEHGWQLEGSFEINSTVAVDERVASLMAGGLLPIRIHLRAGQSIVFDGYLVHAGDRGTMDAEGGEYHPRLHRYLMDRNSSLETTEDGAVPTFPLWALHSQMESDRFAANFLHA
jgi:rRNA maturation protein Nop10